MTSRPAARGGIRAAARSAPDPNLKQVGVSVLGVRPTGEIWMALKNDGLRL